MATRARKRSAAKRAVRGNADKAAPGGAKKPNVLVIWGDDIGQSNLSCYTHGLMGYRTPNIDRIAKEGMLFTDSYGEQSCTAGCSSFITGQSMYRTGLSKVGIPASPIGMPDNIVTMAALLKEQGYATGQFGKNHLGDLNKHLPTVHGFDEFFGNLYLRPCTGTPGLAQDAVVCPSVTATPSPPGEAAHIRPPPLDRE